ncbi:hypothetical protein [Sphingomonas sp.]|uniref:hypothetical protein n=1 Tax=Sphingomonas sp. TaxID=28214 RepID=UPI00286C7D3B|nr:hypothetical protein [Sphingomonas sp.]
MSVSIKSKLRIVAVGLVLAFPGIAAADTASCLSDCTKAFAECKKHVVSTADFANCVQQRKECIESCGNSSD